MEQLNQYVNIRNVKHEIYCNAQPLVGISFEVYTRPLCDHLKELYTLIA